MFNKESTAISSKKHDSVPKKQDKTIKHDEISGHKNSVKYNSMLDSSQKSNLKTDVLNDYRKVVRKQEHAAQSQQPLQPQTQRKLAEYAGESHYTSNKSAYQMDRLTTPIKYSFTKGSNNDTSKEQSLEQKQKQELKQGQDAQQLQSTTSKLKNRQILNKLDQSEQKMIVSEKKYEQLHKKYELSISQIKSLKKQLVDGENKRLQQLLELKADFRRLEAQKRSTKQASIDKEETQKILRKHLYQKDETIFQLQTKLKTVQKELQLRDKNAMQAKESSQKLQSLEIDEVVAAFQRKAANFKEQIRLLQGQVKQMQLQKSKLFDEINQLYQKLQRQDSLHLQQAKQIQQQYKTWLQQAKQQKVSLINSYETKVKKLESELKIIQQSSLQYIQNRTFREQQLKLQNQSQTMLLIQENKQLHLQINNLTKQKKQLISKMSKVKDFNAQLIEETKILSDTNSVNKQKLAKLSKERNEQAGKYADVLSQLTQLKRDFDSVFRENKKYSQQIQEKHVKITNLKDQIDFLKEQINSQENTSLNMNSTITQTNKKLQAKITNLKEENDLLTRELLAERLENAKLAQELKQQGSQMKRQYQLSLENIQRILSKKIKKVKEQKNDYEMAEKQQLYLQLKDLQRKYELLKSEIVTVDDMMSIATKVHKRNSKFVKKAK